MTINWTTNNFSGVLLKICYQICNPVGSQSKGSFLPTPLGIYPVGQFNHKKKRHTKHSVPWQKLAEPLHTFRRMSITQFLCHSVSWILGGWVNYECQVPWIIVHQVDGWELKISWLRLLWEGTDNGVYFFNSMLKCKYVSQYILCTITCLSVMNVVIILQLNLPQRPSALIWFSIN